jgi:hypothetical protein
MKTKKQLDRLFKEQFRNMDVAPPPAVWENISTALQKKKQSTRVVPLWYKLAGVAAALLVFFGVGSLFFNPSGLTQITSEDIITPVDAEISSPSTPQFVEQEKTDAIVQGTKESHQSDEKDAGEREQILHPTISEEAISQSGAAKKQKQSEKSASGIAAQHTQKSKTEKPSVQTDIAQNIVPEKTQKETIVSETKQITEPEIAIAETDTKTEIKEENKKSLLDYIAEKNEEAITPPRTTPETRWDIAPNFAPVYYSSLNGGSSIDPQFSDNSKTGDINYSYGIKVSYALNDRLSVRTGINKVDLSYTTNDIEFALASASDGLQSINNDSRSYAIAVGNRGTLKPPPSNIPTVTEDGTVIVPRSGIIPGTMKQELDYFEIPLELKYTLSNSRFGVNVVGGMSTLLLNNNMVSVLSDGFQSEVGSANNLNNVSFSTNLGLGFDYKLSSRFVFNLEPMFKYQLNPYSDSSIDFKPYYLGVYSGFSYRF